MSDAPIPAATVIVVRDRPDGCELLMVERAGGMAFAAGALVFPGGRIDEADRELAGELGIEPALIADRPLAPLLANYGLEIDPAPLTLFARWVPKFHAVRRFDTLFYVARAPGGDWQPRVMEGECAAA